MENGIKKNGKVNGFEKANSNYKKNERNYN